ncbi:MAG: insulinase family protein [Spirochaetes bacterium]|nr:insulinase family protein [Spirochaetota bacterium]
MMKLLKLSLVNIILFIGLLIFPAFGQLKDTGENLKANVVQKSMPNGINVIMLNRGYTPTLALLISFRVGSVDESYRTIGVAHMLEHMLFKGTDVIGTKNYKKEKIILNRIEKTGERLNELSIKNAGSKNSKENKEIEKLTAELKKLHEEHREYVVSSPYSKIYAENGGVGFNASTSKDMTVYYIELPASKLELWAKLESERLRNPVLREFYIEKQAVLEERLMRYESSGEGGLFEQFAANAFAAHPYRHPIIGWKSNIERFSIKDVRAFYKHNYTASRMTITVVGKQNTGETFKLLSRYFGKLAKGNDIPEIFIKEPEQKGERRFAILFESNPYLLIGWHKPAFPSRTDYIFEMIESILSDGKMSRLYKSLVIEKGLAASIDAWNGYPGARYDNLFMIAAVPKHPVTVEELENAIYQEIEKINEDLSEEEIRKVLNRKESSFIFQMDNNMGIARMLSYYHTNFGDWRYAADYVEVLNTITMQEIRETINQYLTKENRTVGVLRDSRKTNKD